MQTINQQIIFLLHKSVIITSSMYLFRSSPAVSDFTAVNGVFQNSANQCCIKQRIFSILSLNLIDTVIGKVFRKTICPHIGMHILVKDNADCFGFFLVDIQHTFLQFVSVGSKSAVPFTLTCFLDSALHRLNTDILTLNLSNRRQHGNHQLTGILGGINAILHTNQIDTEILHHL